MTHWLGSFLSGLGIAVAIALWLTLRRRRVAHAVELSQAGTCPCCDPASTGLRESPFLRKKLLADDDHRCLILNACQRCNAPALQYSVDIFDDYWLYWCPIDEDERDKFLAIENDSEHDTVAFDMAISAIRERRVLQRHPDIGHDPRAGLTWVDGTSCALEGPPW